jgi:DNA-binding NarL/FixJ family response regulator
MYFMAGRALDIIEVGIVESDDQCRQFMSAVIGGTPGLHATCVCATGKDALLFFARNRPGLFLVSLFLRDMPGTELIQRTRLLWPDASPILLIPENHPRLLVEALEASACAYLPKPCAADELVRAIRTVHQGGAVVSSPVAKAIVDYFRARGSVIHRLTDRESQVLTCMSRGLSQQAMAADLGIDKATVRTHVRNILGKLDAHSSAEAIAFYLNPQAPALAPELLPLAHPPAPVLSPNGRFHFRPRPCNHLGVP